MIVPSRLCRATILLILVTFCEACGSVVVVAIPIVGAAIGVARATRPARPGAGGQKTNVVFRRTERAGELLAAADSGLLMLLAGQISFVPRDSIFAIDGGFRQEGHWKGSALRGPELHAIRSVARYPQGVEPVLLQALLAAYRQERVQVVVR